MFLTYFTGDRVTPTLTISDLLLEFQLPDSSKSGSGPPLLRSFFFATTTGQRIFIQPRGTYRYPPRASLDVHLERAFFLGRAETSLVLDAFNALGASTITGIQTSVNGSLDPDNFSSYNQTTARVPPRTLRIAAGVRF